MPIPSFDSFTLPLLKLAAERGELSMSEAYDLLATKFGLSESDLAELVPSGNQTRFLNRVSWARTYLKKAGLLDSPRRSYISITESGRAALAKSPDKIDVKFLRQYPEFREFNTPVGTRSERENANSADDQQTPEELIESNVRALKSALADELQERIKAASPRFFENLVIELLLKMGYGGSRHDAGQIVGKSGDGGIDGLIKEDKLGLDAIYVQAKRWEGSVSRPEIQKFAGSLEGVRARKGIFITTSSFTREATTYVENIDKKIVMIDGQTLAFLMIDHDVAVSRIATYDIKKVDSDYFQDE